MVDSKDAARRREILDSATVLFARQGFRETNLGQIADELGFRRQAVYHYFRAKEDILVELIADAGRAMTASAEPIFESDRQPQDKLADLVRNHVRVISESPSRFRVQFNELEKLTGERATPLREGISTYVRAIAGVIADGQAAGVFTDGSPKTLAMLIIGMCNSVVTWSEGERVSADIAELADKAARLSISGLALDAR